VSRAVDHDRHHRQFGARCRTEGAELKRLEPRGRIECPFGEEAERVALYSETDQRARHALAVARVVTVDEG
jgi:hypothetical protein